MKKKIWLTAAALAMLMLAAALMLNGKKEPPAPVTRPQTTAAQTTAASETAAAPAESSAAATTQPVTGTVTEQTEPQTQAPEIQTEPPHTEPPAPPETESPYLQFPVVIPDYDLEIRAVKSYDGIYLEDGSDVPISGVAALLVTNHSEQCIELAKLRLTGEKTTYAFTLTGLEAGATAVVMEAGKAPAVEQNYLNVTADVAQTDFFEMSGGILSVEEDGDALKVTNLSGQDLPCVRIFYKFYLAEAETYVGGITYTAKLLDLKAGVSVKVQPSHYAAGSSRVIMAKIYDTDQE